LISYRKSARSDSQNISDPRANDAKEVDECWAFLEFGAAAGLHLDRAQTKLPPPMPDLKCSIGGVTALFELGEILQSDLGDGVAHSARRHARTSH